jgi:hypothetical protein
MSDLRIALVAEGPLTEREILKAALQAVLAPRTFELVQLQPESTLPRLGGGWGGVLKWCKDVASRHAGPLSTDPTLAAFDAVVLHLDADVAGFSYADLSITHADVEKNGWQVLPCDNPCPPAATAASALHAVLLSWLHPAQPGPTSIVCLPAMSTDAWVAAATLPAGHALLETLECRMDIGPRLRQLPLAQRFNKSRRSDVLRAAPQVTANWAQVAERCSRARQFANDTLAVLGIH